MRDSSPSRGRGDQHSTISLTNSSNDPILDSTMIVVRAPSDRFSACWQSVKRMRSSRGAVLAVVSAMLFTDAIIYGVVVPILPEYALETFGLDDVEVGALFAVYAVALVLSSPVFGVLADRFGRKWPIFVGTIGLAICTLCFAFATSFAGMVFARIGQGASAAVTWVVGFAMLADVYSQDELGKAMGFALGVFDLGVMIGPPLGGLLYEYSSFQTPFFFCAGLSLLDALLRLLLISETDVKRHTRERVLKLHRSNSSTRSLRQASQQNLTAVSVEPSVAVLDPSSAHSFSNTLPDSVSSSHPNKGGAPSKSVSASNSVSSLGAPTGGHRSLWSMFISGRIIFCSLATMIAGGVFTGIEPILAPYLYDTYGASSGVAGLIYVIIVIPNLVFGILSSAVSDRPHIGRRRVVVLGFVWYGLSCLLLILPTNIYWFAVTLFLWGTGMGLMSPILPLMADLIDKDESEKAAATGNDTDSADLPADHRGEIDTANSYGKVYALFNMSFATGMSVGPVIFSAIYQEVGFEYTVLVMGLTLLAYAPIYWWALPDDRRPSFEFDTSTTAAPAHADQMAVQSETGEVTREE